MAGTRTRIFFALSTRFRNALHLFWGCQRANLVGPHQTRVMGFISHLDLNHENPWIAGFLERLSSFCRLILFDKRGTGLSDRVSAIPTLEERMSDMRSVMDALGSERAAIFGYSEGGPTSVLFSHVPGADIGDDPPRGNGSAGLGV